MDRISLKKRQMSRDAILASQQRRRFIPRRDTPAGSQAFCRVRPVRRYSAGAPPPPPREGVPREGVMDKTPLPLSLAAALALPLPEGRGSAEILVDGDLELRLYAPEGRDPQTPHDRDELYIVASGHGSFRAGERTYPFSPGDLLFVAAHETHRFEDFSDDFATWVVFYGAAKTAPPTAPSAFGLPLAAARSLSLPPDRLSAEAFVAGDIEVRFAATASPGMQVPHLRDEFYIVATGS